jgi:hypothetical protein
MTNCHNYNCSIVIFGFALMAILPFYVTLSVDFTMIVSKFYTVRHWFLTIFLLSHLLKTRVSIQSAMLDDFLV